MAFQDLFKPGAWYDDLPKSGHKIMKLDFVSCLSFLFVP